MIIREGWATSVEVAYLAFCVATYSYRLDGSAYCSAHLFLPPDVAGGRMPAVPNR